LEAIGDGILRWAARHPEWHPGTSFGAEVCSYALRDGRGTILVDPIAPDGDVDGLVAALAGFATGHVRILVTIPYHVRDSEPLWECYRERDGARILGHPAVAKRLRDPSGFTAVEAGRALPGGIIPVAIGNPRRYETPYFVPQHAALVFGDAVVEDGGALRVWVQREVTPKRAAWYSDRLRPSLDGLLEVAAERILVTHGRPVLSGGAAALRAALDAGPWYHRPH